MNSFWKIATGLETIPQGTIIEIYGLDGTGKTTLMLYLVKQWDGNYIIMDTERGIPDNYLTANHIPKTKIKQPKDLKDVFSQIKTLEKTLIGWDTLAATPSSLEEKDDSFGAQARELSQLLRQNNILLREKKNTLIIVNQARVPMMPYRELIPACGLVLNYYVDLKLFLKKKSNNEGLLEVEMEVKKSRFGSMGKSYIVFKDIQIDEKATTIRNAIELKILEKKPRNFKFKEKEYSYKELEERITEIENEILNKVK